MSLMVLNKFLIQKNTVCSQKGLYSDPSLFTDYSPSLLSSLLPSDDFL